MSIILQRRRLATVFLSLLIALSATALPAAAAPPFEVTEGPKIELREGAPSRTYVPEDTGPLSASSRASQTSPAVSARASAAQPRAQSKITIDFEGFTPQARRAFQDAALQWQRTIALTVPVHIEARFSPLPEGVLGSAGPVNLFKNFPGATYPDTWYPSALANATHGADLVPGEPEIVAQFSTNSIDMLYFGLDGNTPPGKFDFRSIVLHELGHGLGFVGSMKVSGATGTYGLGAASSSPLIFDQFTEASKDNRLLSSPNNSNALARQLLSGNVFFDSGSVRVVRALVSPVAAATSSSAQRARLYAPPTWDPGSSYSHLDEATYPAGTPNSLMTPQIGRGEAIHNIGGLSLAMLTSMGYRLGGDPSQ